jgi:hypothetical protein
MSIAVNYGEKSFMNMATGFNFMKLFWHNLCLLQHNLSQNLRQYVNYAEKSFMKLATGTQSSFRNSATQTFPSPDVERKSVGANTEFSQTRYVQLSLIL